MGVKVTITVILIAFFVFVIIGYPIFRDVRLSEYPHKGPFMRTGDSVASVVYEPIFEAFEKTMVIGFF